MIVNIYCWFCLGLLVLYIGNGLTITRRWNPVKRLAKEIVRLVIGMVMGLGAIYVYAFYSGITDIVIKQIETATFSNIYILLVGNDDYGAMLGFVFLYLITAGIMLWAINKLGDCVVVYTNDELELRRQEKEWLNSKLPKFMRKKATSE